MVSACNFKLINEETDWKAYCQEQTQFKVKKNFSFIATENRSHDLIIDSPIHRPLFLLVIPTATSHLVIWVLFNVLTLLFLS